MWGSYEAHEDERQMNEGGREACDGWDTFILAPGKGAYEDSVDYHKNVHPSHDQLHQISTISIDLKFMWSWWTGEADEREGKCVDEKQTFIRALVSRGARVLRLRVQGGVLCCACWLWWFREAFNRLLFQTLVPADHHDVPALTSPIWQARSTERLRHYDSRGHRRDDIASGFRSRGDDGVIWRLFKCESDCAKMPRIIFS